MQFDFTKFHQNQHWAYISFLTTLKYIWENDKCKPVTPERYDHYYFHICMYVHLHMLLCFGQIISRSTTSRCEMDVTFAGNSNEVTPCKIEFNYRNDFDNYTRWKLREVIKVVQDFFSAACMILSIRIACRSIMGFFEKTKLLFRKKISGCFSLMFRPGWNQ